MMTCSKVKISLFIISILIICFITTCSFILGLIEISQSLLNIFTDDVDIYWISKGFYTAVKNMHESIPKVIDATKVVLEREDKILYRHLNEIEAFDKVQISKWLNCLFAGALNEIALVKIWDKIVGEFM